MRCSVDHCGQKSPALTASVYARSRLDKMKQEQTETGAIDGDSRRCMTCGAGIDHMAPKAKHCTVRCYRKSPARIEAERQYEQSPKRKAARAKYYQTPEGKATQKRYTSSEKRKAVQKRYNQSEKGKAARARYAQSPKAKEAARERYAQSPQGKAAAARKAYKQSPEGKAEQEKRRQLAKEKAAERRRQKRLEVRGTGRTCQVCGANIDHKQASAKRCSDECYNESRRVTRQP